MKSIFTPLDFSFYNIPCEQLAQNLLGQYLIHVVDGVARVGRIIETEAYLGPHDKAAHSSRGKTKRTEVLFGKAGFSYIYLIYGIYNLFNITAAEEGSAVLIRALEPISGIEIKTTGPGLVTKALAIDRSHYGVNLAESSELFVSAGEPVTELEIGPRVGVDYAGEWAAKPLRYRVKAPKVIKS